MTRRRLPTGGNASMGEVIAFRLPGAPAPTLPPVWIPGLPDSDRSSGTVDDDELSADILQFRMPAKAAAITAPAIEADRNYSRLILSLVGDIEVLLDARDARRSGVTV